MIESTRGIVLTYTKYAESSIISHIYTEKFGLQSYMINQVRSKKNKGKTVFLQPLTLLDLEVYHTDKKTIHRIKDFRVNLPFAQIPFEPVRQSLAFFIAEVLNKALKHEDRLAYGMFDFLHHSISVMDDSIEGIQNYHLFLLFKLTKLLGFYPHFQEKLEKHFFDLRTGLFQVMEPSHPDFMNVWQADLLYQLKEVDVEYLANIHLTGTQRAEFMEKLLDYYHLHLSGFSNIKSFRVLKELFK